MTEELKPVRCGCGGEAIICGCGLPYSPSSFRVECSKCFVVTPFYRTEDEAVQAWNRAMSGSAEEKLKAFWDGMSAEMKEDRTAKVLNQSEGFYSAHGVCICGHCEQCGNAVCDDFHWCPSCGCRLEWE